MSYNPQNPNGQAASANSAPVVIASDQSAVPVSAAALPLPSGAASSANQTTANASLASIDGKITAVNTGAVVVSSSALPSGAATAAKQPALGTAGTPSADVITVQGATSMTALKVDGSGVTQPVSGTVTVTPSGTQTVSGTVTANIGTSGSLALDTSVAGLQVSQGSTTSGQKGELVQGAVTTAAPSYTTAQTSPLSLTTAGALRVDNSGTTQPVSGTVTANAGSGTMAVSAASLPLPSGAATAANQTTANSSLSSIDSKITAVNTGAVVVSSSALPTSAATSTKQSDGSQKTQVVDGSGNVIGATSNALDVNIKSSTTLTVNSHAVTNAGTFAVQAAGDVAAAASDSGNPLKVGGVGRTTNPTAVTDGQRVNASFDKLGKQVVVGSIRDLKAAQQTTITSSVAETTIITADATNFLDLYGLILTNTSATGTKVTIKDATGGTTRMVFQVPATETRGFMLPESAAHKQAANNNNWTATCGTSVASLEVTALFVKNL